MQHLINFAHTPRAMKLLPFVVIYLASQIFWIAEFRQWSQRLIKSRSLRIWLGIAGGIFYALLYVYAVWNLRRTPSPVRLTAGDALLQGPFQWWVFSSVLGFLIYLVVRAAGLVWNGLARILQRSRASGKTMPKTERVGGTEIAHSPEIVRPDRRLFFRKAATALGVVPFAAGAYGILYERLDLKISHQRITIPRLPPPFEGFSILQLSDLHIGPFMTKQAIQKVAAISNNLKPDLTVLTGDFVTYDPSTQYAVVDALSGIRAPFGVFGCLGNHEIYTRTEASITALFAARGFRMLRQERTLIRAGSGAVNLIGVDFQTQARYAVGHPGYVRQYLQGVDKLLMPGEVNILLSHNPNTFDRAAQLGIDLTIAGHTHGGQINLEFLHTDISPARLYTPYVSGWFRRGKGQLYVNRGIGTIALPIRLGAPPEITVYHLSRRA
ncbi:MAG: metallophosphoesterase [Terriglobia bacterium]